MDTPRLFMSCLLAAALTACSSAAGSAPSGNASAATSARASSGLAGSSSAGPSRAGAPSGAVSAAGLASAAASSSAGGASKTGAGGSSAVSAPGGAVAAPGASKGSSPASAGAGGPSAASAAAEASAASIGAGGDWLTYHGNLARTGVGPEQPALASPKQLWTAKLDGAVYGEPLVMGSRGYVVTENDSAYALDAGSGNVVWQKHLGEPVPRSELPCGDINPSGITSTPAIDAGRQELYVVGRTEPLHHQLWVLDSGSGAVKYQRAIDPPGADPRYLQQRGALALANGRVYVPFGGNFGDCGPYKGWVVAAPEGDASGQLPSFAVPTQREGAIWAPPGEVVDANGDLLVATGNAESAGAFDYANAVIRLSPELKLQDYWAPSNWQALSRSDTDVGSVAPTLLQDNLTFQIGKAGVGYLLRTDKLGNVGGESFKAEVCSAAFGGTAYQPPMIYVPCTNGLFALRVDPADPSFQTAWQVTGQRLNSPIVAYGSVWSIDTDSGRLVQVSPASGAVQNRLQLPAPVTAHFITPTPAGGRLFVTSGSTVLAFG